MRQGCDLMFRATVVTDGGRRFAEELVAFVAPHDPVVERRSTRAG
jgi:hypothetical protein